MRDGGAEAAPAGFEIVYDGPARPGDIFGIMTRTDGSLIENFDECVTIVYRKVD